MATPGSMAFSGDVFQKVEPLFLIAQQSDPATDHTELQPALEMVEATVESAIRLTEEHTGRMRPNE